MTPRKARDKPAHQGSARLWQTVPRPELGKAAWLVCQVSPSLMRGRQWSGQSAGQSSGPTYMWAEQPGCGAARHGLQRQHENSCYGKSQPGLVDHTCYPSIWGAEAEG